MSIGRKKKHKGCEKLNSHMTRKKDETKQQYKSNAKENGKLQKVYPGVKYKLPKMTEHMPPQPHPHCRDAPQTTNIQEFTER